MNKHKRALWSIKKGPRKNLFEALELAKGVTAESRTLTLLNGPAKPRWLRDARFTPKKDKEGIDVELHLMDETIIPLNIKSSPKGLFHHIQKRRENGWRMIPVLIVRPFETDEQVLKTLSQTLRRYVQGKRRFQKIQKKSHKNKQKTKNPSQRML